MALRSEEVEQAARLSARQIEQDLGIPNILRELEDLPVQIRQQQEAVRAARQAVDEAEQDMQLAEATLTAAISAETDPRTGKAAFSNEKARSAELAKRKSSDDEYLRAVDKHREAKEAADSAQFDLDLLHNRFSSIKQVARLTDARLGLLGGDR